MITSSGPEQSEVIPALDGIRGIAILLVLAHNTSALDLVPGTFARAMALACDAGWIGVQLFFVLSGFLITRVLLRTRDAENYYRAFFGRRVLRIFPLYYAVLVIAFVIIPTASRALGGTVPAIIAADATSQVWLWTYLSNWASPFGRGSEAFPHFWSLAVEEQFYLVWPFVVRRLWSRSSDGRALLAACGALAVLAFASRLGLRVATDDPHGPYLFTVCRLDALCLGGAAAVVLASPGLALWSRQNVRMLRAGALIAFVLGAMATRAYARMSFAGQTVGYSVLAVAFAVWILATASAHHQPRTRARAETMLRSRLLRAFGKYSYGIYVFHLPVHVFVGQRILRALGNGAVGPTSLALALAYMLGVIGVTFALAAISYHAFEVRFLRHKLSFVARVPSP